MEVTSTSATSPTISQITITTAEHIGDGFVRALAELEDAIAEREQARSRWHSDEADYFDEFVSYKDIELKVTDAEVKILKEVTGLIAGKLKPIGILWSGLSANERSAFCAKFESDIWQALEHVADHQR